MSEGLVVVTHTNPKANRDISKCVESVRIALPPNSKHLIIELDDQKEDFQQARYNAMSQGEIVVMVDDDDYISPDSLNLCLQALRDTNAGLAFTYEVVVRMDGTHICNTRRIKYEMISNNPQIIHQMCAIRTKFVSSRPIECAFRHGTGIEWLMKAEAALMGGAVQVPIKGYYWVQHQIQRHKTIAWQTGFRDKLIDLRNDINSWSDRTGLIPVHSIR